MPSGEKAKTAPDWVPNHVSCGVAKTAKAAAPAPKCHCSRAIGHFACALAAIPADDREGDGTEKGG